MFHKSFAVRIAYGSMSLYVAILHNVFLLYYVDIFVSVYKIDRNSFWLGEVSEFVGRFPYRSLVYYACAPLFIENSFNHSRNPLRLKRL